MKTINTNQFNQLNQFKQAISNAPRTVNLGPLEGQILSLLVDDREFFLFCNSMLKTEHFVNSVNQMVWSFIQAYFKENKGIIPSREVLEFEFSKNNVTLPIPDLDQRSKGYVRDKVFSVIRRQRFEDVLVTAMLMSEIEENEFDEAFGELYKQMQEIRFLEPEVNFGTNYFDVEPRWNKFLDFWQNRIPTGFPSLDICLPGGGIGRKELVVFMGPSGVGKSLWLVNIGTQMVRQGFKVVHFSREISEEILSMRYDACMLRKTTESLIQNPEMTMKEVLNLQQMLNVDKNSLWIKEFPTYGANVEDSQAYVAMLKERIGFVPDVIIDDYLDLAKSRQNLKSRYEEQGMTFGEFRGWMVQDNYAGISATQTQRSAGKTKGPITADQTADSIDKVRVSDVFATINESFEDAIAGRQQIYFAKNRNERAAMCANFVVDKGKMSITDLNDHYSIRDRKEADDLENIIDSM